MRITMIAMLGLGLLSCRPTSLVATVNAPPPKGAIAGASTPASPSTPADIELECDSTEGLPPDLVTALGLQFLDPGPRLSRKEGREQLTALIFDELSAQQGWPGDYTSLKQNKAIAIQYNPPSSNSLIPRWYRPDYFRPSIGTWGGGWTFKSLQDARTASMEECGRRICSANQTCIPFIENELSVIPDQIVDEFRNARRCYIYDELTKLRNSERVRLLDRAQGAITSGKIASHNQTIRVAPVSSFTVGNPDRQQDYSDVCQDRILFPLVPVVAEEQSRVLAALQTISTRGTYDEYKRTINTKKQYTQPERDERWERMSRFTTELNIGGDAARLQQLGFPKYLLDALAGKSIQTIWLEGAVRITKDGLPLVPSEHMAPLAVLADGKLYLGVLVRLPDGEGECYVSKPFSSKVLDFSGCNRNYPCVERAVKALQNELQAAFAATPFASVMITNEEFRPGEFGMTRERLPSIMLGPPAYELSTYTFQTWFAGSEDPIYSLYSRQDFEGVDKERVKASPRSYLFLKVTHVFATATHRYGTYSEPSKEQEARIGELVSSAVTTAVDKACKSIGGTMESAICVTKLRKDL